MPRFHHHRTNKVLCTMECKVQQGMNTKMLHETYTNTSIDRQPGIAIYYPKTAHHVFILLTK